MTDYGIVSTGFNRKDMDEILADFETRLKAELGDNFDLRAHTAFYEFVETLAYETTLLWQTLEALYYSGYVEFASGDSLDALAALLGIARRPATEATGVVTFSRSAAGDIIQIPAGTRVATTTGILFETTVLSALEGTEVTVAVAAIDPGTAGNVGAGTITTIPNPISGVESVTNASPTSGGTDRETDSSLRYRTITFAPVARATSYSIRAALLALDGVTDATVEEDYTKSQIAVLVAGGDSDEIDNTIETYRAAGVLATWSPPTLVSVSVTGTADIRAGYDPATVLGAVESAVEMFLEGLGIGTDVAYSDLAESVLEVDGVARVVSLTATDTVTTISAFGDSITVDADATAGVGTITVTEA